MDKFLILKSVRTVVYLNPPGLWNRYNRQRYQNTHIDTRVPLFRSRLHNVEMEHGAPTQKSPPLFAFSGNEVEYDSNYNKILIN